MRGAAVPGVVAATQGQIIQQNANAGCLGGGDKMADTVVIPTFTRNGVRRSVEDHDTIANSHSFLTLGAHSLL